MEKDETSFSYFIFQSFKNLKTNIFFNMIFTATDQLVKCNKTENKSKIYFTIFYILDTVLKTKNLKKKDISKYRPGRFRWVGL
jgi:hypothetical protein